MAQGLNRTYGATAAVKTETTDYKVVALASLCILIPALFNDVIPTNMRNVLLGIGCTIAAVLFLRHSSFDLLNIGIGFGWLAFALFAVFDRCLTGGSLGFQQIALLLGAFALCMSACSVDWFKTTLLCAVILLCIHLAATLIFYFDPDLYTSTVKVWFFLDERNAKGYQSGLTAHYSNNGFLMAFGFLLAVSIVMTRLKGNRKGWIAVSLLFLLALVLTQKRAHLVFAALAFLVLFGSSNLRGKSLKFVVGAVIAIVVGSLAVLYVPGVGESLDRLMGTFEANDVAESTSGRTYLWSAALAGWEKSPVIGNGWGSYRYTWPGGNYEIYAHNEIFQLMYDVGIVGLVFALLLVIGSIGLSWRNLKGANEFAVRLSAWEKAAAYFAFAFQVFVLSYAFTTGGLLQQPMIFISFFLTVGIGIALKSRIREIRLNG